jgi:hypothetical protein
VTPEDPTVGEDVDGAMGDAKVGNDVVGVLVGIDVTAAVVGLKLGAPGGVEVGAPGVVEVGAPGVVEVGALVSPEPKPEPAESSPEPPVRRFRSSASLSMLICMSERSTTATVLPPASVIAPAAAIDAAADRARKSAPRVTTTLLGCCILSSLSCRIGEDGKGRDTPTATAASRCCR